MNVLVHGGAGGKPDEPDERQAVLDRLDLVTREEFDAQAAVLAKTREKVEALEARVAELENRLNQ